MWRCAIEPARCRDVRRGECPIYAKNKMPQPRRRSTTALLLGRFVFDVFDDVADCLQFLSIFVRHFDPKLFFKGHHEFDDIQRVCPQILNERCLRSNLLRVHAKLLDDDVLDLLFDRFFRHKICSVCVSCAGKAYSSPGTAWQVNELKRLSIIFRVAAGKLALKWPAATVTRRPYRDSCRLLPFAIRVDEPDDISHHRDCRSSRPEAATCMGERTCRGEELCALFRRRRHRTAKSGARSAAR